MTNNKRNDVLALALGVGIILFLVGFGQVISSAVSSRLQVDQICEITCNELHYTYLKAVHQPFEVIDCWCQKENGEPIQVPGIGSNGK